MKLTDMYRPAEFWNSTAAEFDSIYTGAGKNVCLRLLDSIFRKDIYQRFDWVMDRSGDLRGMTTCDIGCGPGHFVTEFAKRGAALSLGLDIAPNMLALASERALQHGVAGRCQFALGDLAEWQTSSRFDLTVAIGLWDYIANPAKELRRIRSFTRGRFLSAWPRLWTWRMPVRKVRLQYLQGCPVYFYRRPEVYALLKGAGFSVARCETIGKLFCVEAE